jgi:peptidoglycan/LPS O-acetylase OafA/YrhL
VQQTDERRGGFRADIQGLRAVAVGAVLAYHAGLPFVPGGFAGVDVFFVISGFLITGHLLRERELTGRISLVGFYARRVRRILPAALVVAVLTLVVAPLVLPATRLAEIARDGLASVLFVPNVWFGVKADDYLAGDASSPFLHYWSLGVEEQFYLIWPALVLALLAVRRRSVLVVGLWIVFAVSFVACLVSMTWSPTWTFYSLHTRAWEFAAGALVAVFLARRPKAADAIPEHAPRSGWLGAAVGWAGLAAILGSAFALGEGSAFPGPWAIVPVVGTALVIAAPRFGDRYGPRLLLTLAPLRFLGLISFSLYLIHWPALELVREGVGLDRLPVRVAVLISLAAIALAALSYRFVERPFTTRAPRRRVITLGAGAAATVLAVGVCLGVGAVAALLPTDDGRVAPTVDGATPFVPSDLIPALSEAESDRTLLYDDGCHAQFRVAEWKDCRYGDVGSDVTVALFGDSHAAAWFPALQRVAEDQGFELRAFTKSACPASTMESILQGQDDVWCTQWREAVIAELAASPVDLVILADHFATKTRDPDDGRYAEHRFFGEWEDGAGATVSQLTRSAAVLVIGDVAKFDDDPVDCLAEHLDDALSCGRNVDDVVPLVTNAEVKATVESLGATYADYTTLVCPDGFCAAILGRTLVFRDTDHLSTTFSRSLAPQLGATVAGLLGRD